MKITMILLIPLIFSCSVKNDAPEIKPNREDEICSIIEICLDQIAPKMLIKDLSEKNNNHKPFILIEEKLLLISDSTLRDCQTMAVNPLIEKCNWKNNNHGYIPLDCISNTPFLNFTLMTPLTDNEMKGYAGGVIFSRAAFSEDSTIAVIAYHYTYKGIKETESIGIFELRKSKSWQITKRTILKNSFNNRFIDKDARKNYAP